MKLPSAARRGMLLFIASLLVFVALPRLARAADLPGPWVERLTINYLRSQTYPGSPIIIDQTLPPGQGYLRYIVSFRSEGLKEYGLLLVPGGKKPPTGWPAIVFNHGYIEPSQYQPTVAYEAYMDALVRAGYIVFRPDLRGHGRSEGDPENAFLSPAYTIDVLNAVASVKQYPDADPRRIGMWGHSMGGWMTLRAMVVSPDIQAGVIWGGAVGTYEDMLTKWLPSLGADGLIQSEADEPPGSGLETGALALSVDQSDPLWRSLSANYFLDDLSGPLQLYHSIQDRNVPVSFSEELYQEGKAAGMPVELLEYKGDNHDISVHFRQAMQSTIAFYDKWLRNPVDLADVKGATVVAPGIVNLRSGPSTASTIVGQMQRGQQLPILASNGDRTWWLVEASFGRAWVAGQVTLQAHTAGVPQFAS
jgi:uncharacterized protein